MIWLQRNRQLVLDLKKKFDDIEHFPKERGMHWFTSIMQT